MWLAYCVWRRLGRGTKKSCYKSFRWRILHSIDFHPSPGTGSFEDYWLIDELKDNKKRYHPPKFGFWAKKAKTKVDWRLFQPRGWAITASSQVLCPLLRSHLTTPSWPYPPQSLLHLRHVFRRHPRGRCPSTECPAAIDDWQISIHPGQSLADVTVHRWKIHLLIMLLTKSVSLLRVVSVSKSEAGNAWGISRGPRVSSSQLTTPSLLGLFSFILTKNVVSVWK